MEQRSTLELHPVLNNRFSPRAFSDRDVTDAELDLVLEAARWAPSSRNEQPWRFLVTRRGGEGHAALFGALTASNQVWVEKAPVLILNLVVRTFARNGQENFHARHDLGGAIAQLTIQATALGMGLHQLGGLDAEAARAAFAIPDTYDVVSALALGFPGDPDSLPEHLRERELVRTQRRPLSELVFRGRFPG
jgi:nitroreductase